MGELGIYKHYCNKLEVIMGVFDFLERVVEVVEDTADWASDQVTDAFEWTSDQLDSVIDLFDIGGPDHKTTDKLDDKLSKKD